MSLFSLEGKISFVTGAGSGIGQRIALGLAEAGASVGCFDLGSSKSHGVGDRGIRVNSISPGYTATPMNVRPEVAEQVKKFEADTPLRRMATVDELVGPAIFLSSQAASFCTGIDLVVDGGFVCW
jgi:NAD(P)-dependent dehydrogenase (short-subunit alcohol dehydrogenase family)